MTQPDLQTHELQAYLDYEPLDIYWAFADLLLNYGEGYIQADATIDGEEWVIDLAYSDSGIASRPSDDLSRETVYEWELHAEGAGEQKIHASWKPRWENLEQPDGTPISTPWDHHDREGVEAEVQGSNVHPDDYEGLLARFVAEVSAEAGYDWNQPLEPFRGRLVELERYLRLDYQQDKKLIGSTGTMQRLMMHLSEERGTKAELSQDNEERVGKQWVLRLQPPDVAEVLPQHTARWGRQLKSYLPRNPQAFEPEDDLYHPKVGALYRKSLSRDTVSWEDRQKMLRELDETVLNSLAWSDIPLDVGTKGDGGGNGFFVPDDHFSVEPRLNEVPVYPDPTPELEAQQDSILAWALSKTTESDHDVLTALTDGGRRKEDLAEETGWSESTLYRALQRLEGVIESENGHFRFTSRRFKQEIAGAIDTLGDARDRALRKVEQQLDYEVRSRADSSFEAFLAKYGAEFITPGESGDRPIIRLGDLLTRFKSLDHPRIRGVAKEAISAWKSDLRNAQDIRNARLEADLAEGGEYRGRLANAL